MLSGSTFGGGVGEGAGGGGPTKSGRDAVSACTGSFRLVPATWAVWVSGAWIAGLSSAAGASLTMVTGTTAPILRSRGWRQEISSAAAKVNRAALSMQFMGSPLQYFIPDILDKRVNGII